MFLEYIFNLKPLLLAFILYYWFLNWKSLERNMLKSSTVYNEYNPKQFQTYISVDGEWIFPLENYGFILPLS